MNGFLFKVECYSDGIPVLHSLGRNMTRDEAIDRFRIDTSPNRGWTGPLKAIFIQGDHIELFGPKELGLTT